MDWPDPALAHRLVQSYFENIHDAFPILDRRKFQVWYAHVKPGSMQQSDEDIIWLGTLNIIFAITSYHAQLTLAEHHRWHTDHLLYCARAKVLFLNDQILHQDARISTVCALGLLALYHIATCRMNWAWPVCGLAIRQALSLGLNVRSEAEELTDGEKEHRVRIWWSLYSLECLLNELTGRPSCISDTDISTPLPINMDEVKFASGQPFYDQGADVGENVGGFSSQSSRRGSRTSKGTCLSQFPKDSSKPLIYQYPSARLLVTPSTYFIYRVQLSIISHEVLTNLYCASTIKVRWSVVQSTISRIDQRLLKWDSDLPDKFTMDADTCLQPEWNDIYFVPRISLAILYNSSRMILFRPCLCRFEDRLNHQRDPSQDFNQKSVEECIKAARRMIALLSGPSTSLRKIYAIPSWWHTLHCLCQALSILALEIAFRARHVPTEAGEIIEDAKRGVSWLSMMASRSISARKAWEVFDKLIRLASPGIDYSPFDMP
ncbi:fungal-specific transcription factor domain-containing protein, partial [Amylocarpus encephaloides]